LFHPARWDFFASSSVFITRTEALDEISVSASGSSLGDVACLRWPPKSLAAVRVRWIVDLKKNFGYESFERVKDVKKPWKQQQGITFLTPEEVLVYQVKSGAEGSSHARLHMIAEVFDTRDGHELKRLVFPADSETGRIMPTRGGAFLVHNGKTLTVYSGLEYCLIVPEQPLIIFF
jgi:hypothetical protein